MFNGDNQWSFIKKPTIEIKGQWTQKVYQVDDSPRYEGSSSWVHVDGKSYWENKTNAPLPRREYTQRSDYNITVRRNRHEITDKGWIHDQDNDKVIKSLDSKERVIAQEKGFNNYVRVDDSKCQAAQDWWGQNRVFWADTRNIWSEVYDRSIDLKLASKIDGKKLYEHLFGMDIKTKPKKIKKVIESFVKEP
jgi:hypothetical protein